MLRQISCCVICHNLELPFILFNPWVRHLYCWMEFANLIQLLKDATYWRAPTHCTSSIVLIVKFINSEFSLYWSTNGLFRDPIRLKIDYFSAFGLTSSDSLAIPNAHIIRSFHSIHSRLQTFSLRHEKAVDDLRKSSCHHWIHDQNLSQNLIR